MSTHPNDVPKYDATPEMLDQIYARTAQQLVREQEAKRRALEWPGQVDKLLASLVGNVAALQARVAELEAGVG